jgi:hypothetical protein
MNQQQQPRPYNGAAVYTATTYALVAATAALAALVGVAGALWLRQRQWATDASSSSGDSGSQRGEQPDDDGDVHGEDADGAQEDGWVQSGLLCPQRRSHDLVCLHCPRGARGGMREPAIACPFLQTECLLSRYDAGLRTGSVLGRCWEWLESAAAITPTTSFTASHEVHTCL